MLFDAWMKKAESHMVSANLLFENNAFDSVINFCFLAIFSVIKALLSIKSIECKTHEGLIYLFKINYVDNDLFDSNQFKVYCKIKELNTEFLRFNDDFFTEELALKVIKQTNNFIEYSKRWIAEDH